MFAPNTHDFLIRLFSGFEHKPIRILTTDGEFHAFRRQADRWEEAGEAVVTRVPLEPFETFDDRFVAAASGGEYDAIVVSQVFFKTGQAIGCLEALADLADPAGPWVIVDGYHGFMATPTDLSAVADRIFYVSGGYKYAMTGEGAGLLHAPHGYCERPVVTGWFAEFGNLMGPPEGVQYRGDAGRFWGATFDATPAVPVQRRAADAGRTGAGYRRHLGPCARAADPVPGGAGRWGGRAAVGGDRDQPGRRQRPPRALHGPEASRTPRRWRARLLEANVVTDVRDDTIRFGFGLYQDPEDVERLIAVCDRLVLTRLRRRSEFVSWPLGQKKVVSS